MMPVMNHPRGKTIMIRIVARVPESLADRLKIRAVREHRKIQEIIADAIEKYLKTPLAKEDAR
jgi:hypothetical protein